MEKFQSILAVTAAVVPIAHFFYTLGRDFRKMRIDRPRVRVFVTMRRCRGQTGVSLPTKCACVCNVSGRTVSVVEVRTSPERGVGVITGFSGRRDIAPGGSMDFPLVTDERLVIRGYPTSGEVFVELGTGEVFSVTF